MLTQRWVMFTLAQWSPIAAKAWFRWMGAQPFSLMPAPPILPSCLLRKKVVRYPWEPLNIVYLFRMTPHGWSPSAHHIQYWWPLLFVSRDVSDVIWYIQFFMRRFFSFFILISFRYHILISEPFSLLRSTEAFPRLSLLRLKPPAKK